MKIPIILISSFLTIAAFDTNLFRRRRDHFSYDSQISLDCGGELLQEKKIIKQHRLNVIPKHLRDFERPVRSKCNYFSTKPRAAHFSDHQKLRRMWGL